MNKHDRSHRERPPLRGHGEPSRARLTPLLAVAVVSCLAMVLISLSCSGADDSSRAAALQTSADSVPSEITASQGSASMNTYLIRRRNGWKNAAELEKTGEISGRIGSEEMADKVRWIRSYVVKEDDGTLGTVCIYQAINEEALREHARRVGMPADEIVPIANTVVVNADPEPAMAGK